MLGVVYLLSHSLTKCIQICVAAGRPRPHHLLEVRTTKSSSSTNNNATTTTTTLGDDDSKVTFVFCQKAYILRYDPSTGVLLLLAGAKLLLRYAE
jgi:hypothetical protein